MDTQEIVRKLHTFSIPTRILEVGCGVALSNLLLSENNASHTIYDVRSPYSRKAQLKIDDQLANHRAVSIENTTLYMVDSIFGALNENLIHYVANFQIGGNPEKKQTTHGYIMIAGYGDEKPTCYHITIPGEAHRGVLMHKIAEVGLAILYNKQLEYSNQPDLEPLPINYVDHVSYPIIADNGDITEEIQNEKVLDLFLNSDSIENSSDFDNFLCYHKGAFVRFEDFFRGKTKVMFYRGTFNPITNAHMALLVKAVEQENPDFHCLMIAKNIYNKPGLTKEDILTRMAYADALELPLVIATSYRYLDSVIAFRLRTFNAPIEIQFIMGEDTVVRVFQSEPEDFYMADFLKNVTYLYVKRLGFEMGNVMDEYNKVDNPALKIKVITDFHEDEYVISASMAREYLKEGNISGLETMLPKPIFELFTKK